MSPNQWTKNAGRTAETSPWTMRMSKEERVQFERFAREAGMSLADFARSKLGLVPKDHKPLGRRSRKKPPAP